MDDAPENIEPTEYLIAENMRLGSSLFGDFERMEQVESNRLFPNLVLATGDNTVVGKCVDFVRDRIFFFVANSLGKHGIYCFDGKTIMAVMMDADVEGGLGFDANVPLHSMAILGNLLYWVQPGKNPRRINAEAALKASNPAYSTDVLPYAYPVKNTVITVIRKPPMLPPIAEKREEPTITGNFILNDAFRFAWFYTYRDFEDSVLSPHSKLVPYGNVVSELNSSGTLDPLNAIEVVLPIDEDIPDDVLIVNLVAINAEGAGLPVVVKRWDRRVLSEKLQIEDHNLVLNPTSISYLFTNQANIETLPGTVLSKPYEPIPWDSRCLATTKNRLFLGNNSFGYDSPKLTSLKIQIKKGDNGNGTISVNGEWVKIKSVAKLFENLPFILNNTICIAFFDTDIDINHAKGYYYNASTVNHNIFSANSASNNASLAALLPNTIDIGLYQRVGTTPQEVALWYYTTFVHANYTDFGYYYQSFVILKPVIATTSLVGVPSNGTPLVKSGGQYVAGIVFYDKYGRSCDVVTNNSIVVTMPDRASSAPTAVDSITFLLSAGNELNEIPIWAYYYSIVWSKDLVHNNFIQFKPENWFYVYELPEKFTDAETANIKLYSPIPYAIAFSIKSLILNNKGYTFQENDLVNIYLSNNTVIKLRVKSVIGDYILCPETNLGVGAVVSLIEVYSPVFNAVKNIFFEEGNVYKVVNPSTNSRLYSTRYGLMPGDCYASSTYDKPTNTFYFVEAMSPNKNKWKNWLTSAGRVQAITGFGSVTKKTSVVFSNVLIDATKINGLSTFEALNEEILPLESGSLQKLLSASKQQQLGNVLLAICEESTYSLAIGESEINDSSGAVFFSKSDRVIGNVSQLRGGYGTKHPESAAYFKGIAMWYDVSNGCVVQYSQAGLDEVSRYKVRQFFALYSRAYLDREALYWQQVEQRSVITGCFNEYTGEYLIALPNAIGAGTAYSSEKYPWANKPMVLAFSAEKNKWHGLINYLPDESACLNNQLYSFKAGQLYIHDVDSAECEFYGVKSPCIVSWAETCGKFVATKVWHTLAVVGLVPPDYVLATSVLPYQQKTDLVKEEFTLIEGKHYAQIRRNMLTPGMTEMDGLNRGENIRSQTLYVQFVFNGTGNNSGREKRIFINSAIFGFSYSKGHTV